ncbi:hypothetical protein DPMN_108876 [Dreissena polymorpha]|uniref:Secreted protein n=1 Tax=Dreissena polymorpha TaxID=45954 RepID=A0A9D4K9A0_DREPO|nr:hypothetical protein DPMN_108876 [Dreissena polymorpha]
MRAGWLAGWLAGWRAGWRAGGRAEQACAVMWPNILYIVYRRGDVANDLGYFFLISKQNIRIYSFGSTGRKFPKHFIGC